PGRFRFPYGLEVIGDNELVVVELGNNRVQIVDPVTGESRRIWGSAGARRGMLRYPWACAFDPQRNRLVIVDSGNNRLQIISPE
ncbi:MAG: hypothetical protein AAGK78_16110, partial [Planctomycetota bacterium]